MTSREVHIRIKEIPKGPAPEEVRSAWVGLELPATPFSFPNAEMDFTTGEIIPSREAFAVEIAAALEALRSKSPEAAAWFFKHIPPRMPALTFGADEVEIVPNEEPSGKEGNQ